MEISQQSGDLLKVEELKAQIAELNASKEDINEFGQGVNQVFESAFEGFFTDVISGTKSVSEAFKDMGKQILAQIAQIVAKWLAAKVMGAFNPGAASSIGANGTGGGMGDMLGSLAGAVFGGFKESGGYTMSGNAYVVGEKGPEIFMPQTAGSIIPNHSLGGGGGQGTTNIYVEATDANSFRRSSGQIATSYANAMNRNLKRNG
jgi:phage-related minor tail protein